MSDKLIINAALTGIVATREQTPHVPISPEEIAEDARRCRDAGASIVHIHARDEKGLPACRKEVYCRILREVRERCPDIILCVSTSGRRVAEFERRAEALDVDDPAPEMASLTLGSFNFMHDSSVNAPETIERLARRMTERGIAPEWECFEIGMIEYSHYLIRREILRRPYYCNLFLGSRGTLSATAENLTFARRALPEGVTWAVAGIGRFQYTANRMAVEAGGHVRTGLEDNLWYDDSRSRLATNADLVARIADLGRANGREPASPAEARRIIGLANR